MKTIKLLFLAFPLALASLIVFTNPAQASNLKFTPGSQHMTLVSDSETADTIFPGSTHKPESPIPGVGCNCFNCVQIQLQMQGKLPLANLL
jgi:hypothetical protein